jgi:hypothetical protein
VIYRFTPNYPSLDPPPIPSPSPNPSPSPSVPAPVAPGAAGGTGSSASPAEPGPAEGPGSSGSPAAPGTSGAGALPGAGSLLATPSTQPTKHGSSKVGTRTHKGVLHASGRHWRLASAGQQHGILKARLIHQD